MKIIDSSNFQLDAYKKKILPKIFQFFSVSLLKYQKNILIKNNHLYKNAKKKPDIFSSIFYQKLLTFFEIFFKVLFNYKSIVEN